MQGDDLWCKDQGGYALQAQRSLHKWAVPVARWTEHRTKIEGREKAVSNEWLATQKEKANLMKGKKMLTFEVRATWIEECSFCPPASWDRLCGSPFWLC